jgi:hypothetical protein
MQGAAAYPRDISIDRFAGERMTEGATSRLDLDQQPTFEQRVKPVRAACQLRHQRQIELTASYTGKVEQPQRPIGQSIQAQQHGIAERIGDRQICARRQFDARIASAQPTR